MLDETILWKLLERIPSKLQLLQILSKALVIFFEKQAAWNLTHQVGCMTKKKKKKKIPR